MPTHEKRTETEELEAREMQGKEGSLTKGVSPAEQQSRSHGEPWLGRPWDPPGGRALGRSRGRETNRWWGWRAAITFSRELSRAVRISAHSSHSMPWLFGRRQKSAEAWAPRAKATCHPVQRFLRPHHAPTLPQPPGQHLRPHIPCLVCARSPFLPPAAGGRSLSVIWPRAALHSVLPSIAQLR